MKRFLDVVSWLPDGHLAHLRWACGAGVVLPWANWDDVEALINQFGSDYHVEVVLPVGSDWEELHG